MKSFQRKRISLISLISLIRELERKAKYIEYMSTIFSLGTQKTGVGELLWLLLSMLVRRW